MAATTSPMASQLKSGFTTRSLVIPKGISGPALRGSPTFRRTPFIIKAVQSEKVYINCYLIFLDILFFFLSF